MVTPNQAEYSKGLWRAQKQGRDAPALVGRPLGELGQPGRSLAGIVLAAGTIAWYRRRRAPGRIRRPAARDRFPWRWPTAVLDRRLFRTGLPVLPAPVRRAGQDVLRPLPLPRLAPAARRRLDPVDGVRGPMRRRTRAGYPFFALSPVAGIGMIAAIGDEAIGHRHPGRRDHAGPALHLRLQLPADRRPPARHEDGLRRDREEAGRRTKLDVDEPVADGTSGRADRRRSARACRARHRDIDNPPRRSTHREDHRLVLADWRSSSCWRVGLGSRPASRRRPATSRPRTRPSARLYVAEPGIRNYLEYGGHGLLVFDIDHDHRFVKRIPTAGLDAQGKPINVKGICASARTKRLYISTIKQLMCLDLVTEKLLWEKTYDQGCDRMAITPDGTLDLPARLRRAALVRRPRRGRRGHRADHAPIGLAQHDRRAGRQGSLSRRAEVAVSDGRRHADAPDRPHGRPVRREHPAVHGQRRPDALLRERQRAARLRGRRPEDGPEAVPRRGDRVSTRARPSGTAAPATGSA